MDDVIVNINSVNNSVSVSSQEEMEIQSVSSPDNNINVVHKQLDVEFKSGTPETPINIENKEVEVAMYSSVAGAGESGSGFYNMDIEKPLGEGEYYTIERAVEALANDTALRSSTKSGMIITFYNGSKWMTYRYKNRYDDLDPDAQTSFADVSNWEEFQSGGGGQDTGSRIILRRLNGDVITAKGSSVSINFFYDHVTGPDDDPSSTGNAAAAQIIINRSGYQETITRTLTAGTYSIDITKYLGVGVTSVRLQARVNDGDVIQTATVSWIVNIVELTLITGDLTGCKYAVIGSNNRIDFHYTLESGSSDTKTVICYLDGVQTAQHTINTAIGNGAFSIETNNLTHGGHTIQLRAQQATGQLDENENPVYIYSNLIFAVVAVYDTSNSNAIVTMKVDIENGSTIFASNQSLVVHVNQYDVFSFKYGAYRNASTDTDVTITEDGVTVLSATNNRQEATFSTRMLTNGTKEYTIAAGNSTFSFSVIADEVDLGVEVPSGRKLLLDSVQHGHSNSDSNRNTWQNTEGGVTTNTTMSGFTWSGDGWVDGALRLRGAARAVVNYNPLRATASGGTVVGFKYRCSNAAEDSEDVMVISCIDNSGTGFYITPTNIVFLQYNDVRATMKTAIGNVYDVAFVAWPRVILSDVDKINERFIYIYIDGILSGGYKLSENSSIFQVNSVPITIGNSGVTTDIFRLWAYDSALNDSAMLNTYILDQDDNMEFLLKKRQDNNILDHDSGDVVSPASLPDGTRIMIITGQAVTAGGETLASVIAAAKDNVKKKYFPCAEISTYIKGDSDRSKNFIARANGSDIVDGVDMSLKLRLQGTSSLAYPVKNYRIYTKKSRMYVGNNPDFPFGESGSIAQSGLFAMHDNSAPVNVWCLKADYAESSSTHNTGMACMVNDTLKSTSVKTPAQHDVDEEKYPYEVRTTVDGEPCILFYRETLSDTPIFLGKFNFNNDKSTEAVYGFTGIKGYHDKEPLSDINNNVTHFTAQQYHAIHKNDTGYKAVGSLTECWEFKTNEFPMGSFLSDDFDSSTDGVRTWTGTFEARYPDDDGLNADFESGAVVPHYLKTLVSWVKSTGVLYNDTPAQKAAKLAEFKNNLHYYFNVEHLCCYFAFTQIMACLDQMVKNMMLAFWYDRNVVDGDARTIQNGGPTGMGRVRGYMIFYDNDTILGVINDGKLRAPYDVTRDTLNNVGGYYFAGHDSVLWNNLSSQFEEEIRLAYVKLRGYLTNDRIFEYFDERQAAKFCERIYNLDALNKYVSPIGNIGAGVTELMQGSRITHRHFFVEKRMEIYDNYFATGRFDLAENKLGFKGEIKLSVLGVESSDISLKLAKDGNVKVSIDGAVVDGFSGIHACQANTLKTLKKYEDSAIGSQHWLFGTKMMTFLDLSKWNISSSGWEISQCEFPRLEEFVFGIAGSVFTKPDFGTILNVYGAMPQLKKLTAQNCSAMTGVNVSNCSLIEEVDIAGSLHVTSVTIQTGSPLKKYVLPTSGVSSVGASLFDLHLVGLPQLAVNTSGTGDGLYLGNLTKIGRFTFNNCPNIDPISIITSIVGTTGNSLNGVDVTLAAPVVGSLETLKTLVSIDSGDHTVDYNVKIYGKYTINDAVTAAECEIIGYDAERPNTEQSNPHILGLTVVLTNIVTPVLQTYDRTAVGQNGYNPAACVALHNAGLGHLVDLTDATQGWYLSQEEINQLIHLPAGTFNAASFTDVDGICGTVNAVYNFTSFPEFAYFHKTSFITDGTWNEAQGLFRNATALQTITLPTDWYNNITGGEYNGDTIDNKGGACNPVRGGLFHGCTALTTVVNLNKMHPSLFSTRYIFYQCAACTTLGNVSNFPTGIQYLGENSFAYTGNLVTSVGSSLIGTGVSCFMFCSITNFTLPATLTGIAQETFYYCRSLTSITILATTPPSLGSSAFEGLPSNFVIYVPAGSVSAYQSAAGWNSYSTHIQAIS